MGLSRGCAGAMLGLFQGCDRAVPELRQGVTGVRQGCDGVVPGQFRQCDGAVTGLRQGSGWAMPRLR